MCDIRGTTVYVVHNEPDMSYYGNGIVHGVFLDRADAERSKEENSADEIDEIVIE